jgi:hypothetical protein
MKDTIIIQELSKLLRLNADKMRLKRFQEES